MKIGQLLCAAVLCVMIVMPGMALAQDFEAKTYTCEDFSKGIEAKDRVAGLAVIWALGWIDHTEREPVGVSPDRVSEVTAQIFEYCTENPEVKFTKAVDEYTENN